MTKLFEKTIEVEPTEQELAQAYDASLQTYREHIESQKNMQEAFVQIGEKMWVLKLQIDKANYIRGLSSEPEKKHLVEELGTERIKLLQDWQAKEVSLRYAISDKFYQFVGPYLSEIDEKIAEIQKTLAVSHLKKVRFQGKEALGTVLSTNFYAIQRAIGFLKTQRSELEGCLPHNTSSEDILKLIETIGKECPEVLTEEKAVTALEMEFLQEATNLAMDMRNDNLVPADSTSKTISQEGQYDLKTKRMVKDIERLKEKKFEMDQKAKGKEAGF